jgi:hypothetical protein
MPDRRSILIDAGATSRNCPRMTWSAASPGLLPFPRNSRHIRVQTILRKLVRPGQTGPRLRQRASDDWAVICSTSAIGLPHCAVWRKSTVRLCPDCEIVQEVLGSGCAYGRRRSAPDRRGPGKRESGESIRLPPDNGASPRESSGVPQTHGGSHSGQGEICSRSEWPSTLPKRRIKQTQGGSAELGRRRPDSGLFMRPRLTARDERKRTTGSEVADVCSR